MITVAATKWLQRQMLQLLAPKVYWDHVFSIAKQVSRLLLVALRISILPPCWTIEVVNANRTNQQRELLLLR